MAIAQFCSAAETHEIGATERANALGAVGYAMSMAASQMDGELPQRSTAALGGSARGELAADAALVGVAPFARAMILAVAATSALAEEASAYERFVCAIVPASFVAAGRSDCTGAEFVSAIARGVEVALRMDLALGARHRERGWDIVGSAGRIGATAAVCAVFQLSPERACHALGYASTASAGLEVAGLDLRALNAGKVAADSLEAVELARHGLIGPPEPLEGRRGLFALVAPEGDFAKVTGGLGTSWQPGMSLSPLEFASATEALEGADGVGVLADRFNELLRLTVRG